MDIHQHFIFHKPYGTISQFVNPHKRKKRLLGEFFNFPDKTMAIGRLDVNSEGLLLLTTNGKVSEEIRSKKVENGVRSGQLTPSKRQGSYNGPTGILNSRNSGALLY